MYCWYGYTKQSAKQAHQSPCGQYNPQYTEYPKEEDKRHAKTINKIIYADFLTMPQPFSCCDRDPMPQRISGHDRDPIKSYTDKIQYHKPCGYSYMIIGLDADYSKPAFLYYGPNAGEHILESMVTDESDVLQKLNEMKPMKLMKEQWRQFDCTTDCHICEKLLKDDKVHVHCHLVGDFCGAAHNACNLYLNFKSRIRMFCIIYAL